MHSNVKVNVLTTLRPTTNLKLKQHGEQQICLPMYACTPFQPCVFPRLKHVYNNFHVRQQLKAVVFCTQQASDCKFARLLTSSPAESRQWVARHLWFAPKAFSQHFSGVVTLTWR